MAIASQANLPRELAAGFQEEGMLGMALGSQDKVIEEAMQEEAARSGMQGEGNLATATARPSRQDVSAQHPRSPLEVSVTTGDKVRFRRIGRTVCGAHAFQGECSLQVAATASQGRNVATQSARKDGRHRGGGGVAAAFGAMSYANFAKHVDKVVAELDGPQSGSPSKRGRKRKLQWV